MTDGCRAKGCDVRNKCKHFWATYFGAIKVNNRETEKGGCEDFKEFTEEEIREIDQRQKERLKRAGFHRKEMTKEEAEDERRKFLKNEADKKAQRKREELLAQKAKPRKV